MSVKCHQMNAETNAPFDLLRPFFAKENTLPHSVVGASIYGQGWAVTYKFHQKLLKITLNGPKLADFGKMGLIWLKCAKFGQN